MSLWKQKRRSFVELPARERSQVVPCEVVVDSIFNSGGSAVRTRLSFSLSAAPSTDGGALALMEGGGSSCVEERGKG
jgi:hypothetical protein